MTTNKKSEAKTAAATSKLNQEIVPIDEQPTDVEQKPEITITEPVVTTGDTSTDTQTPEAKSLTKADRARVIYLEMVQDPANGRDEIAARIKQELGVSKSAGQTYFYQFQRESGRVREKQPTKVDAARPLYIKLVAEGRIRQDIIDAFVKEIGLTPAGASTYYQNLKREAEKANQP